VYCEFDWNCKPLTTGLALTDTSSAFACEKALITRICPLELLLLLLLQPVRINDVRQKAASRVREIDMEFSVRRAGSGKRGGETR
jgi:hypothetical protein